MSRASLGLFRGPMRVQVLCVRARNAWNSKNTRTIVYQRATALLDHWAGQLFIHRLDLSVSSLVGSHRQVRPSHHRPFKLWLAHGDKALAVGFHIDLSSFRFSCQRLMATATMKASHIFR